MKRLTVLVLSLVITSPLAAQENELRKELDELRKGQEEIQRELAEIKKLLQNRPQPAPSTANSGGTDIAGKVFSVAGNPVKGDAGAELILIEFTDYQCGYCNRHLRETYPRIVEEFVDTGKLKYTVLDLPLERIHPLAFKAAEASHCAADQGKYWEMHDRLFAHQKNLEPWSAHAEALGLDGAAFSSCLESSKYRTSVRRDMVEARKAGATGTPSFVLGRTNPSNPDQVTGLRFIRGAKSFDAFQAEITEALQAGE